jgi:hypothetical protein
LFGTAKQSFSSARWQGDPSELLGNAVGDLHGLGDVVGYPPDGLGYTVDYSTDGLGNSLGDRQERLDGALRCPSMTARQCSRKA